ncbi:MAG: thiolase family protein, partial [Promethearchaeota archaeon]
LFDIVFCGGLEQQSVYPIGADLEWVDKSGTPRRNFPHPSIAKNPYIRDPFDQSKQGVMQGQLQGAEMIGKKYNADRKKLDEFSLWSHEKAAKYGDLRHEEIVPIDVPYIGDLGDAKPNLSVEDKMCIRRAAKAGKIKFLLDEMDHRTFEEWKEKLGLEGKFADNLKYFPYKIDEGVRTKTTLEMLSKMKGAVRRKGILTAGNSCPENDGASAMLVMSRETAEQLGMKPRATIKAMCQVGSDPVLMLTGPQIATKTLFKRYGYSFDDFEVIEVNEAFSTVVDAFCKDTGFNMFDERLNQWGGAIAVGHPTASTGCRLIGTIIHQLEHKNAKPGTLGLATLCVGLGMGTAAVVEIE